MRSPRLFHKAKQVQHRQVLFSIHSSSEPGYSGGAWKWQLWGVVVGLLFVAATIAFWWFVVVSLWRILS